MDLNHVDSSMRVLDVCLAMFPIVQSPLWLATLLHFARFCMCGSICLWLVWALCSCRCKRAPHVVFFVPVVSGASVKSLFEISPMR